MTVEGRERYPVRVRYARDFRTDEETLKPTLVGAGPGISGPGSAAMPGRSASGAPAGSAPVQVPLAEVADVRIVEGPSMIKSEKGLLRS